MLAAVTSSLASAGLTPANFTLTTSPASVTALPAGIYVSATVACNYWSTVGVSPLPAVLGGLPANKQLAATTLTAHE